MSVNNNNIAEESEFKTALKKKEQEEMLKMREREEQRIQQMEEDKRKLQELREKNERRRQERAEEEKLLRVQHEAEAERKRIEQEEWRQQKELEVQRQREARERRRAELDMQNQQAGLKYVALKPTNEILRNSVMPAKEDMVKSREQLEIEKKETLAQRCGKLDTEGLNTSQLQEKATELFERVQRLLAENYDLDQRYKRQQYDIMELSERARQMDKGKETRKQRPSTVHMAINYTRLSEKYSQAPPPVALASKYEHKLDRRSFAEKIKAFERS